MCGRRKCNLGILEWILKSIRGSNNLTLVGSLWLELDLILLLETRVFNAMLVLVRLIWSNLCWKWVGLGCPFPGACRIPKNSSQFPTRPLSLYCPKLVTLYYVTFYEMEQLCRSTSYRKFTLNPWRKKLLFVKLFSTFTFIRIYGITLLSESPS